MQSHVALMGPTLWVFIETPPPIPGTPPRWVVWAVWAEWGQQLAHTAQG